jgi:hypothetical protein
MSVIDFRDQNRKLALSVSLEMWNNFPRSIFLADLEENSEPPSWFKNSPWNAPSFRLPSAFARHAQSQRQRTPFPAAAATMTMMVASGDAEQQFREAASRRGLELPNQLVYGQLSRCSVAGDKGKKQSGSYLYYADGVPAGGFQNWKDGLGWEDWRADIGGRKLTPAEVEENRRRRREAEEQRAADEGRALCRKGKEGSLDLEACQARA